MKWFKQPPAGEGGNYKKPKRPGWLKWLVMAVVLAGAYWWFAGSKDAGRAGRMQAPIGVATVTKQDVPVYLNGLGTIQAYNTVTLHAQVDGQLMQVLYQEGQMVHAGDVLVKIDPRIYQAQLDQALANKAKDEAALENARRDLLRYTNLGNSVSGQTVDTQRATVHQLEATVKADQAAVDNAHIQLAYTSVISPIDGRTGIRQVDVGNLVHSTDATGLVVVTQLQPISVIFSLPQQNLIAINEQLADQKKLSVVAMDSTNTQTLDSGELALVDNEIDQTTGTIKLKATFPNAKEILWPGGFTNVRLLLTTQQGALVIPTVCVQRGPQGAYVFVYKQADGTVEMRAVKVGIAEGDSSVIDQGLQEGEQVVSDGMAKLQDGTHVVLAGAKKADDKKADAKTPDEKKSDASDDKKEKHHPKGQE